MKKFLKVVWGIFAVIGILSTVGIISLLGGKTAMTLYHGSNFAIQTLHKL